MSETKPALLVAKGVISRMGGAERDLIRRLPHLTKYYDVSVATLSSCEELESVCTNHGIDLYKPDREWVPPNSSIAQIFDMVHTSSKNAWIKCQNLINKLKDFDYFHVVSGDGYLALLQLIPPDKPAHLYLLEPHRGYHEDSLHRGMHGNLRRPKIITSFLLAKGRRNDLRIVKQFSQRRNTQISGNSSYTASRIKQVYQVDCEFIHPCVDSSEYSEDVSKTKNPYPNSASKTYVSTIGIASWAKGSMEVISMLSGTDLSLVHVGGGHSKDIETLVQHAANNAVDIWIAPKLTSNELSRLIKDSVAVVSMAHKEPFGLTPIEAFSVGTPAIFVEDGGFIDSIIDHECGRLIPRTAIQEWHAALHQAKIQANRQTWAKNGRQRIIDLKLSPTEQAEKVHTILQSISPTK